MMAIGVEAGYLNSEQDYESEVGFLSLLGCCVTTDSAVNVSLLWFVDC